MVMSPPPASFGSAASGGLRQALAAHGQSGRGMERAPDAGKLRVMSRRRQQRDAERNAVGAHRGRQREAAEVEQVDEIGVGAEPGVEFDRVGQHLRDRVGGRSRRQHHRVEVGKDALGNAPQRLQPVERRERIGRGQPRAGRGDLARDRMNRVRRGRQQVADHQIAFGNPWPLVEQPRGLIERFEVEFDQRGAERGPALQRFAIGLLRCRIAEEDQLALARHAEPELAAETLTSPRAAGRARTDRPHPGRPWPSARSSRHRR